VAIGSNQLNVYLFEVGMLTRIQIGDRVDEQAVTLGLHPLVVAAGQTLFSLLALAAVGGPIDRRPGK